MTSKISETAFKEKVLKDLKESFPKAYVLKTQERGRHGVPDILMSLTGRFVAIELKRDLQFPDKLQQVILDRINASGGHAFWTTPSSWEMHLSILKDFFANSK